MITFQCGACCHVWRREGRLFGRVSGMVCPQCKSASVTRIGKRRGKWQRKELPCDEHVRASLMSEEVWQRTAPRGQAHKGKGPRS